MIEQQTKSPSTTKQLLSFPSSSTKHQNILKRVHLDQFIQIWNQQISCRTSCEYFQYRLQYVDTLKTLLIRKFDQIINNCFVRKKQTKTAYTLKYDKQIKSQDTKLIIEIQVVTNNESYKLTESNTRLLFDKLGNNKTCSLIILNVSLVNELPEENQLLNQFGFKLQELLLYFIVQSHRIEPSLVKQQEESVQLLQNFTFNELERIKETYMIRLQLNLIDQSKYAEECLRGMILSPSFCKYFSMVEVKDKNHNRIKYIYKQSIKQPKGKDYLTFQDRNFSFEGFRKHICYLFPFWFSLELVLETENQKPHCEIMLIPPMFSQITRAKLIQKIINYIINLSEATNVKVLLNLMQKKHYCPFSPYQLFINNKIKKIGYKNTETSKQTVLKVPFLYVSAYPLYERFAHGNGLQNIKKSQLWKQHTIDNLQYTYVIRFKSQIFIVVFRQDTPYKQKKNLTIESRMRKLLIYEVYGVDTGISKQEIDLEFRRKIRQSQLEPLLNKISQHLIIAPQVLNRSELEFLQNGKKYSFKVTLPYMSCYGIYLSYLKQKLNYIHRKTSKKRNFVSRKMSHLDLDFSKQTEVVRFSSYVQDANLEQYQYSYNQEQDMLFLFNYAAPRGNYYEPFGNCIYLLSIGILSKNKPLDQISQYVFKQPISTNSKKKSFYIYGVDPTELLGDKYKKQIKQLIQTLNQKFTLKQDDKSNKDNDAISSSSSVSGSDNIYDDDMIPTERKYSNLTIQFKYQIIGNEDFNEIQKYCRIQIESTYCDYLIEGIIFRLKQSMDEYIHDLPLMNKKKKKLSFDDIEYIIQDSLNHLIPLDKYEFMKKSLTIFNYQTTNMKIRQHTYYQQILSELTKNIVNIINVFTGIVLKKVDMIYYVLNGNKKLINYGNYSKLLTKGDYSSFIKTLNPQVQIGVFLGSHLSELFQKIDEDSKKSTWTHSIKQYPDGRFFNSDTFVFKRNFLLKISISKEGIRYFSYNVNRNINHSIIKNIEAIVEWHQQREYMLSSLKNLKLGKGVEIPDRILNMSLVSIGQVWDPYHQIEDQKQNDIKKNNKSVKPMSLTSLFKLLVFELMPPIEKIECMNISHSELNRIYELLKNQKIDFEKYGEVPKLKNPPFKCELGKLGFQVLSILRFMVLKEWKKKQEEDDV